MSDEPVGRKSSLRKPLAEPVRAKDGVGPHRERGLPGQTRDHPAWPAFRRWADERLGDVMLATYWECWLAALRHASEPTAIGLDTKYE